MCWVILARQQVLNFFSHVGPVSVLQSTCMMHDLEHMFPGLDLHCCTDFPRHLATSGWDLDACTAADRDVFEV